MPVINDFFVPPSGDPTEDGPCVWPVDISCFPDFASLPLLIQTNATAWATYILWALTGRRFGSCPVTVRPCGPDCQGPGGYLTFPVTAAANGGGMPWMIPWIDAGIWRNCGCAGGCTCSATCEVRLVGPVISIEEVVIDGLVLDPSAYRLDWVKTLPTLVRTDGGCWPKCQDMDVATTEIGSFSITYQKGITVPVSGRLAAGRLAWEFAKACQGQECALPQQLSSLTRNGVSVEVVSPTDFLDSGLTGIADVDLWIRAVNPARKAQVSRVYSSDIRGPRVVL
jgi:hypothetical protein